MSEAVFSALSETRFQASGLARGPWDPDAQHGGAPAALLMRAFELAEGADEGLLLARVTYEFVRPVPLGELTVEVHLSRPGRRVQLLEGSLRDANGVEVVRARALRMARTSISGEEPGDSGRDPSGPEQGIATSGPAAPDGTPMFGSHAMEIRFVEGAFFEPGRATAWFRLRVPVIAGEQASPLQRLAAAGDFGNGISAAVPWDRYLFINPDLTLYIEREPVGEWIALRSQTRIAPGGVGLSESVLFDQQGRVGRALQALFVSAR